MIVIEGGEVIDPSQNLEGNFDLLVKDGVISDIQPQGSFQSLTVEERIDASGRWILPGLVDIHVHLRDPGQEWKETVASGCEAAIVGGYTTMCCMPNTEPAIHSAEIVRYILERAKEAGLSRVLPIGAVSLDRKGEVMAPLSELREAGCVAFSDDGDPVYDAGLMRRALEWCTMLGTPISCHEEDKCLSCGFSMHESPLSEQLGLRGMPGIAEDVMVARDIELARFTGGRVHICHVSTARGVELLRRAKNDGIPITAEVTPHHLTLTEEAVSDYDTNAKMSPPLRTEEDREALFTGLCDGTLDAVASDHAPHETESKQIEFSKAAMGILGLQTSLPLLLSFVHQGLLSRSRLVEVLATGPAKCFGLEYGTLKKSAVADLIVLDPNKEWTFEKEEVRSLSFNSPFLGQPMQGRVESAVVNGKIVLRNSEIIC